MAQEPITHTLLGIHVHDQSEKEFQAQIEAWLQDASGKIIVTPNAEMILRARKSKRYREQLNKADLSLPDSVSLRYATAALTDRLLQHRRPGVDALKTIAELTASHSKRLMLLGGDPNAAEDSADALRSSIDGLNVIGINPGDLQYSNNEVTLSRALVESLEREEADVVAVALGMEKQEAFMNQVKQLLPHVNIWIGVGGAFEMYSGQKQRAPILLRKMGLEFVWRLVLEPKRLPRILKASIQFPIVVALETIKQRRFIKAMSRVFSEVLKQLKTV
jgi:N-acetylglucosaminyldiphosphoundecaprenol N-acetyl-beta-D-mannosaminyltransferase